MVLAHFLRGGSFALRSLESRSPLDGLGGAARTAYPLFLLPEHTVSSSYLPIIVDLLRTAHHSTLGCFHTHPGQARILADITHSQRRSQHAASSSWCDYSHNERMAFLLSRCSVVKGFSVNIHFGGQTRRSRGSLSCSLPRSARISSSSRMFWTCIADVEQAPGCWRMNMSKQVPTAGVPPPHVGKNCGRLGANSNLHHRTYMLTTSTTNW